MHTITKQFSSMKADRMSVQNQWNYTKVSNILFSNRLKQQSLITVCNRNIKLFIKLRSYSNNETQILFSSKILSMEYINKAEGVDYNGK